MSRTRIWGVPGDIAGRKTPGLLQLIAEVCLHARGFGRRGFPVGRRLGGSFSLQLQEPLIALHDQSRRLPVPPHHDPPVQCLIGSQPQDRPRDLFE